MGIELRGNVKNIPNVTVIDNGVDVDDVPVDIPSYRNRNTEVKTIRKYLQARNGNFDRGLWQPPLVAELPNGDRYLFDGDHRRHLWKLAYPQETDMPAQIIPVKNKQEISRLFVVANRDGRKALLAEEVFVHEVLSGDLEAVKTGKNLAYCGLKVSLGTGEPGTVIGDPNGPEIKIIGFKKMRDAYGVQEVKEAVLFLQQIWPVLNNRIDVELLGAFALLFKRVAALSDPNDRSILGQRLIDLNRGIGSGTPKEIATHLKKAGGGSFGEYASRSIAIGVLKTFHPWLKKKTLISKHRWTKYYQPHLKDLEAEASPKSKAQ